MQSYLNLLDHSLIYKNHYISNNECHIFCEMKRKEGFSINTKKVRIIKDVDYSGFKTTLHIATRKYFPSNGVECYTSDILPFLNSTKRMTQRYEDYCLKLAANQTAVGIEKTINRHVSDNTILRIIKKNHLK